MSSQQKIQRPALTGALAVARSQNVKRIKWWAHQSASLQRLKKSKIVYDTSDPGTGKTRVALAAYDARRAKGSACALILAPKSLLETAWGLEIEDVFPHLKFSIATARNRATAFEEDADVYITNVDAAKWLADQKPAFFKKFDTLIVDEITAFKHRTAQRSKALRKITKYFPYRQGLTGTPNSNTILDVWHQIAILDDGARLGNSFFAFRSTVCAPQQVGPRPEHIQWVDRDGAEEAVSQLISDITIRNKFEDCMDIPPNFVHTVPFRIPSEQRKVYETLVSDSVALLKNGELVDAVHAAALQTKLLQVASGAVYTDQQGGYAILDTARTDLILDLVEEREHSIVFFNWRHQKDQLLAGANKRKIAHEVIDGTIPDTRRAQIVRDYQAGKYQTLFLHPRTGAHGLTLTRGTATIWSSPIYEADTAKQGLHRIYRGGQTKRTETILVSAKDTVEEKVYDVLQKKTRRMVNLLQLLE